MSVVPARGAAHTSLYVASAGYWPGVYDREGAEEPPLPPPPVGGGVGVVPPPPPPQAVIIRAVLALKISDFNLNDIGASSDGFSETIRPVI